MNTQLLDAPRLSPLQFTTSVECGRWVEQLPLTNIGQAQRLLISQVAALDAAGLPAIERLNMLEILAQPIAFVQGECVKRYAGKPLPLDASDMAAWHDVIKLWQGIVGNYQRCLAAFRAGEILLAPHAALVTARLIRTIGRQMTDYYRIYQHVPGELWGELHALYLAAEQYDYLYVCVPETYDQEGPETTCARAYTEVLLAHLANPYGLSARQCAFMLRWVHKWASLVKLVQQPLPVLASPALAVDLDRMGGAAFLSDLDPAANLRHLDVESLAKALRQTITALKQGETPAQLGLGSGAQQPGCESLLMLLYVQWCRAGTGRIEEREEADEEAGVCFGIPAAHAQLSGHGPRAELTSREKRDLDTFGYVVPSRGDSGTREVPQIETCRIGNVSPSGFMCVLRDPKGPGRVSHHQVVALRRGKPGEFRLGIVQWMRVEANGELRCGVRLFPGAPQAVTVRPANARDSTNRYEPALLLAADPVTATPPTLILLPGWFQCGAFIEVVTDRHQIATMLNLLEKGSDFDRGTVTLI